MTDRSCLGSLLRGDLIRALCVVPLLAACTGGIGAADGDEDTDGLQPPASNEGGMEPPPPPPSFEPPPPSLRRLTQVELANTIQDL